MFLKFLAHYSIDKCYSFEPWTNSTKCVASRKIKETRFTFGNIFLQTVLYFLVLRKQEKLKKKKGNYLCKKIVHKSCINFVHGKFSYSCQEFLTIVQIWLNVLPIQTILQNLISNNHLLIKSLMCYERILLFDFSVKFKISV